MGREKTYRASSELLEIEVEIEIPDGHGAGTLTEECHLIGNRT